MNTPLPMYVFWRPLSLLPPLRYNNPNSGIRERFACGSETRKIFAFGIRDHLKSAQGIQNTANDWNPESNVPLTKKPEPLPGIRNPRRGIQSPRLS